MEEGCVGAGAGVVAFGFKAGIGTSSRQLDVGTVGVLVQSNHGGRLVIAGEPIGEPAPPDAGGSVVLIVAVDAPLDSWQLGRLARRACYALARTGASYGGRSGDLAIAFATEAAGSGAAVSDAVLEDLWGAIQDAVDEAVLNSLTTASDAMADDGTVVAAIGLPS